MFERELASYLPIFLHYIEIQIEKTTIGIE